MPPRNDTSTVQAELTWDVPAARHRALKAEWVLAAFEFTLGAVLIGVLVWAGVTLRRM